ncbi:MAG: ABC1 kinase family protein [Candidatus Promineifilaceae bacterium]
MSIQSRPELLPSHRGRYRSILWFFGRGVAHLVFWDLLLGRLFKRAVRRSRPQRLRRLSRRFRELAVEMGGVMIKLGQFLSARVDVLPREVTEELAGLQDEVPAAPLADVEAVLEAEFGRPESHFTYFEPEPMAAASLGQAHRARLAAAGDGRQPAEVIVKVQRPEIEGLVQTDLAALRVVARWMMRYRPIRRRADVPALMEQFAGTLYEELDYELEAANAERFAEMFAGQQGVRIPRVYRDHSTARVLVLEDVSGIKITDLNALDAAGVDRRQVAERLLDLYFQQIFKEGFFHADPHPGNLFVLPRPAKSANGRPGGADGAPPEEAPSPDSRPFDISFVDFGMAGRIEELMGSNLRRVLVSISERDAKGLTDAYNDLGFFLPGADLERISQAQERVLNQIWGRNLMELSRPDPELVQDIGREFRDVLFEFPFQVPVDFIFLGRTLGLLSGLASLLDPDINPWRLAERYGREMVARRERWQMSREAIGHYLRQALLLPAQAQRVLEAAEQGRLRLQLAPDRATQRRMERIERHLGRPNWSVLAAALVLAGTFLYVNGEGLLAGLAWLAGAFFIALSLARAE